MKLLLWIASSSSGGVGLKVTSSKGASVSKSSARRASTHVFVAKAGFETSIETSSKVLVVSALASSVVLASVLWIQRTVLPKVHAFVSSAGLIAFFVIPLSLDFFKFLQLGLCFLF